MDLLQHLFSGNYQFERFVSSPNRIMRGQVCFEILSPEVKRYTETGSYQGEGMEQDFYQKRFFLFQDKRLLIQKSDGALLHEFDLPEGDAFPVHFRHLHLCQGDQYQLDLCLQSGTEFSTTYFVSGKNKNYHIKTRYWREG